MDDKYLPVQKFIEHLREKEGIEITYRTLRYYAKEGIFPRPAKMGGNRAHYYLAQIPKLRAISHLKSIGKSIEEIKRILPLEYQISHRKILEMEEEIIRAVKEPLLIKINELLKKFLDGRSVKKHKVDSEKLRKSIAHFNSSSPELLDEHIYFLKNLGDSLQDCGCIFPKDQRIENWFVEKLEELNKRAEKRQSLDSVAYFKHRIKNKAVKLIETHQKELALALSQIKSL